MSPTVIRYRLLNGRFPLNFSAAGKMWTLSISKLPETDCWRAQLAADGEVYLLETGYTESDLDRRLTEFGFSISPNDGLGELFRTLESIGLAAKIP